MPVVDIDIDALKTLYNNTVARLNELVADPNKHKVSYNIDGQSVNWNQYHKHLCDCLDKYASQIERYEDPWELEQEIRTC